MYSIDVSKAEPTTEVANETEAEAEAEAEAREEEPETPRHWGSPLDSTEPIPAAPTVKKKHRLKDKSLTDTMNEFIKDLLHISGVQANEESWLSHRRGKSQPWAAVRT